MPSSVEQFGDIALVNDDIAPVAREGRTASGGETLALWAALGIGPGIYALALRDLPMAPAMASVLFGTFLAWGLAQPLGRLALRYGTGSVAALRAACGWRGAVPLLVVWWAAAIAWASVWASNVGDSAASLLGAATGWPVGVLSVPGGGGLSFASWAVSAVVILAAWMLARGGAEWLRRLAALTGLGALGLGLGLVIFAGIASRGFGSLLARRTPWAMDGFVDSTLLTTLWLVPAIMSVPDWLRYVPARRRGERRSLAAMSLSVMPLAMVATALMTAFVGALLAAASVVGRGRYDGTPIADAAGFGGLAGGYGGGLLAFLMLITTVPTLGLFAPAHALSGASPSRLHHRGALRLSTVAAIVLIPLVRHLGRGVDVAGALLVAMGPVLGVLWADERWVRRGRVLLEDLYLADSDYGPWLGLHPSAVIALVLGELAHPWVWPLWPPGRAFMLGAVVAALTYGGLRLGGRGLVWLGRRARLGRRPSLARDEPQLLDEASSTHALADADLAPGWGDTKPDDALVPPGSSTAPQSPPGSDGEQGPE
ncbi:MAG: cytosine permease [Myxococcota bacterium]